MWRTNIYTHENTYWKWTETNARSHLWWQKEEDVALLILAIYSCTGVRGDTGISISHLPHSLFCYLNSHIPYFVTPNYPYPASEFSNLPPLTSPFDPHAISHISLISCHPPAPVYTHSWWQFDLTYFTRQDTKSLTAILNKDFIEKKSLTAV